jgi:PPOX class probable F420-dependent enzyme
LNLTTYRKSGEPVRTPVWFVEEAGKLYMFTNGETGKVKRIRHTERVLVGPSDARGTPLGAEVAGFATLVNGSEAQLADAALTRKYGLMKRLFTFAARLRRQQAVYIAVQPATRTE